MVIRYLTIGAAALVAASVPASADPGDHAKKQWERRADCEKKLYEAKSPRDFHKQAAECDRELAKLDAEQRKEAAKAWRKADEKWRERHHQWADRPYYDWDD
jgi:hypothetical protein